MASYPCKDCPDREQACWDRCERYQSVKRAHNVEKEKRRKAMDAERYLFTRRHSI